MTKITNATIGAAIGAFTLNRDKLRDQAHTIAMMIFMHAAPSEVSSECNGSGDCTMAPKLLAELPRSWAELMRKWFTAYTPIRVSSDGKTAGYDKKYGRIAANTILTAEEKLEKRLVWWKIEDANSTRFDLLAKDGGNGIKVVGFDDLVKMISQLAKRIETASSDDAETMVVKPEDVLSAKALVAALNGLHVERIVGTAANEDETDEDEGVSGTVVTGPTPARRVA